MNRVNGDSGSDIGRRLGAKIFRINCEFSP